MSDPKPKPPKPGERPCHLCGAPIWFAKTPSGKPMPLDTKAQLRALVNRDGIAEIVGVYTTHWETCPNADSFRKPKEGTDGRKQG